MPLITPIVIFTVATSPSNTVIAISIDPVATWPSPFRIVRAPRKLVATAPATNANPPTTNTTGDNPARAVTPAAIVLSNSPFIESLAPCTAVFTDCITECSCSAGRTSTKLPRDCCNCLPVSTATLFTLSKPQTAGRGSVVIGIGAPGATVGDSTPPPRDCCKVAASCPARSLNAPTRSLATVSA